ncbi:hypothetical protein [Sphingomonas bacterium]|uniref:energy transducer TonB n=1 Tax=Sphingomonas bacterium TaxID=1895847 RepID=UPI00262DD31E|nr:hypothetical protein [Sphingomonas bacterium]MDB5677080.1 hypothetical protein [Sphingomonas bacterium]
MRTLLAILLLTLAANPAASLPNGQLKAPTKARTPVPLLPAEKWKVENTTLTCVLTRGFGEGVGRVDFGLELDALGIGNMSLALEPNKRESIEKLVAHIVLPPSDKEIALPAYAESGMTAADRYSMSIRLDREDLERLTEAAADGADEIRINVGDRRMDLRSGPIKAAIAALFNCQRLLVRSWGADPDAMTEADGGDIPWFRDGDLPFAVRKTSAGGLTIAAVSVDRAGKPTGCRLFVVTGTPAVDAVACTDIVKRGRFKPARTGDPAVRWAVVSHRWARGR